MGTTRRSFNTVMGVRHEQGWRWQSGCYDLSRSCGDLFVIASRMAETIRENLFFIQISDIDLL